MERRQEIRVQTNEPVVVTELGASPSQSIGGMVLDMSESGISIKLPHALRIEALIRVEGGNMLLLGEVVRCRASNQGFQVGVLVRHALQNLKDLENLNRALLGAEAREHSVTEEPAQEPE